jgi:hypothetical protein
MNEPAEWYYPDLEAEWLAFLEEAQRTNDWQELGLFYDPK